MGLKHYIKIGIQLTVSPMQLSIEVFSIRVNEGPQNPKYEKFIALYII